MLNSNMKSKKFVSNKVFSLQIRLVSKNDACPIFPTDLNFDDK